jgi:hypothetical protein
MEDRGLDSKWTPMAGFTLGWLDVIVVCWRRQHFVSS